MALTPSHIKTKPWIAVLIAALADGKTLQYKPCNDFGSFKKDVWTDMDDDHNLGFMQGEDRYRVKPGEKFVLVFRAKGTKDAWAVRHDTGTKDALEKRWKEDVARYGRLDEYEYTLVQIPEA